MTTTQEKVANPRGLLSLAIGRIVADPWGWDQRHYVGYRAGGHMTTCLASNVLLELGYTLVDGVFEDAAGRDVPTPETAGAALGLDADDTSLLFLHTTGVTTPVVLHDAAMALLGGCTRTEFLRLVQWPAAGTAESDRPAIFTDLAQALEAGR